jgi:hypothetical protein
MISSRIRPTLFSPRGRLLYLGLLAACLTIHLPPHAGAVDIALGPLGIQARLAKTQFGVDGSGQTLGQVEIGRPGDPDLDNLVLNFFHPDIDPGGPANVGVADIAISPPSQHTQVRNHATQVAGVMVGAANATQGTGVAEGATLFSSATGGIGQPFTVDATEWVRGQGARIVNYSFGSSLNTLQYLPPGGPPPSPATPAVLDGNNLWSLYIDYAARQHDMLFVVAGNEAYLNGAGLGADRSDVIPTDAYNSIVVAAGTQRTAGGRFDQVSNINNIGRRGGAGEMLPANNTADGRVKTDIVAPGASNDQLTIVNLGPPGGAIPNPIPRRVARTFPVQLAANEFVLLPPGPAALMIAYPDTMSPSSNSQMPSLIDHLPAGAPDGFFDSAGYARSAGTSFAAPMVTGTAGLVHEVASNNGVAINHLTTKAAILNGASKHLLTRVQADPAAVNVPFPLPAPVPFPALPAPTGDAWPITYNTRTPFAAGTPYDQTQPLDGDMGAGLLNSLSSLRQVQAPARNDLGLRSDTVGAGARKEFAVNAGANLKPGSLVVATLAWDRNVETDSPHDVSAYKNRSFQNLNLELVEVGAAAGTFVARSSSPRDNVEHIYFNVPKEGKYVLRVHNSGAADAPFGLSWSTGTTDGIAFSVAAGARGVIPTGAETWPNDVNSLGTSGPAGFQTQSEIFVSGGDMRNMARFSGALQTRSRVGPFNGPPAAMSLLGGGPGVLGLTSNDTAASTDNVGGLSWGRDGTQDEMDVAQRGTLVFSVTNSGDLLKSKAVSPFGNFQSDEIEPAAAANEIYKTAKSLGLDSVAMAGVVDDLDAVELESPLKDPDGAGALTAVDSDGDGMPNLGVFFNLALGSPSLGVGTKTADDIFIAATQDPSANFDLNAAAAFSFSVFAEGATMKLAAGDVIDAIALSDVGTIGSLDVGSDEVLFSLAAGSPSLVGGKTAGDVFYSDFNNDHSVFATAAFLGIAGKDLNALDIARIPEPTALAIAAIAVVALAKRRRASWA